MVTGLLSPVLDGIVSGAASSPGSDVRVSGLKTDIFWTSSVDSVVVTGEDGLVVRVIDGTVAGSLPVYLMSGRVRGIDVGYLDILLPPPATTPSSSTFDGTLGDIDRSVVATTDLLWLHGGRIGYPDAPLLDSMSLETSITREPALELGLRIGEASAVLPGFGRVSASGRLHLDGTGLSSSGLTVEAPPGMLRLAGRVERADGRGSVALTGRVGSWEDGPVTGWAEIRGQLEGTLGDPVVDLAISDGEFQAMGTGASVSADTVTFGMDTLAVSGLGVRSDMLSASLDGRLVLSSMDWSCSAWLDLAGFDMSRFLSGSPRSNLNGSVILTASGNGGEPYGGSLTARMRGSSVDTVMLDSASVSLDLAWGTFDVEAAVGTPEGSAWITGRCETGSGWVPVSFSGKAVASLTGVYRLDGLAGIEGSVSGISTNVAVSGAGRSLSADGRASLGSIECCGLSAATLSWTGSVGIRSDGIELSGEFAADRLEAGAGNGAGLPAAGGSGIGWDGDLRLSAGSVLISGLLSADSLNLERDGPAGLPGITAAGLHWEGTARSGGTASDLDGTLSLSSASIAGDETGGGPAASLSGLYWEGSGRISEGGIPRLDGDLRADSIRIADMNLAFETGVSLHGDTLLLPDLVIRDSRDVNIHAEAAVVLGDRPALHVSGMRIGIGTKLKITSDGELALRVAGDSLMVDTLWLEPPVGLLTASGRLGPGDESVIRLGLDDIDMSALMNVLQVRDDLSGIGDLTVDVSTGRQSLSADIQGTVRGPSYGKWTHCDSLTVDISVTESDLNLNGLYVWYDGNRSGLQARIDDIWENGRISIRPRSLAWLELELNNLGDWLFFALPLPVKTSGAAISARVEYTRGTESAPPELEVFATARIQRVFVTSLGMQFPDVTLYVQFPDTTTSRYNSRASLVSGTDLDGTFSIQLLANVVRELRDISVRDYQLNASLEHWRTIVLGSGEIELSGYLHSSGDNLSVRPEIQGRITVDRGVVSYSPGEGSSSSGGGSSELPFDLKVQLLSEHGLWFRSSMANIELSADLRILTQSRQLTASGTVQTVRGKVRLLQKDFDITHGSIEVRQGLPPEIHLDIHAVTTVRDVMSGENYEIEIVISGDPSNPQILLSGTGPAGVLAQEDVLSLLAVGLTYGELQQMDTSTIGSEFEFVAQSYVGQLLASHIRQEIGLDALEITPELLSDSTALTVRVGKYVLPDLYISYTGDFFSPDPGVISAQYYISRDFSVLGSMKSTLNGNQEPSIELHYTLRY
jgi:hypothetical protein